MTNISSFGVYQSKSYESSRAYSKTQMEDAYNSQSKYEYSASAATYERSESSVSVTKTNQVGKADNKLSDKAQSLLDELREKYKDMDIFVGDFEEGNTPVGKKEYSLLISADELEKMAADEDYKKSSLDKVDTALSNLKDTVDKMTDEEKKQITNMGVTIKADGTVEYFAELTKTNQAQREKIEAAREKKHDDAKKELQDKSKKLKEKLLTEKNKNASAVNAYKQKEDEEIRKTTVKAGNADELLEKIRNIDWKLIEPIQPNAGMSINFQA